MRAIAGGHIQPDALILLGAPYQWIADKHFHHGVSQEIADEVKANYATDPTSMLTSFQTLMALGDTQEKAIIETLAQGTQVWKNGGFWLNELATATAHGLDFSKFPRTMVVHGAKDKVIAPQSADAYIERIHGAEFMRWPDCAHAPHLHDPQLLDAILRQHV